MGAFVLWQKLAAGNHWVGEIEVRRNGRFVYGSALGSFNKRRLTIGARGDIVLISDNAPDVVAQLYAERGDGGQIEVYLERIDVTDGSVSDTLSLYDGIEVKLPDGYSLKYTNPVHEEWYTEGGEYV